MSEVKEVVCVDQQFSVVVRRMKIGQSCKRDFLKLGCTDMVRSKKGTNSIRRGCMALYLDDNQWPQGLLQQVKECKSLLLHIRAVATNFEVVR